MTLVISAALSMACSESEDGNEDSLLTGALAALAQNISSSSADPIYLFHDSRSNLGYSGSQGGRSGLDTICSTRKSAAFASLSCTNVRAWISVSSTDSIAAMPVNYSVPITARVLGPTGTQIADNWADLLDGTVSDAGSLKAAGLFDDITPDAYYWVGGNANAGTANLTCSEWSSASGAVTGHILNEATNSGFATAVTENCNNSAVTGAGSISLVCLCI